MTKVKVGFIGCGGIAQYHFGHFERMRDKAEIVATCDLLEERATAAERFGQAISWYKEMFEKESWMRSLSASSPQRTTAWN